MNTAKKKLFGSKSVFEIVLFIILAIYSLTLIVLLAWAIMSSFKTSDAYNIDKLAFPSPFSFESYSNVLEGMMMSVDTREGGKSTVYIETMIMNSVLYAGGCALFNTFCTATVAYCTSRYKGAAASFIHNLVIVSLILPIVGSLPATLEMSYNLKLTNHLYGMYVLKFSFNNMYYLIFYAFFSSMSWGYAESAFMDGASHFTVYFRIMLPLAIKLFLTIFLLFFISYWNDYQTPLLFLRNMPTLALGLFAFMESTSVNQNGMSYNTTPAQIAAGVVVFVPIFTLFIVFRNKIMGNLTEGGIKE